jgi:hypothetical protein
MSCGSCAGSGVPIGTAIDRLVDGGDGESFCKVHGDALVVRIDTGATTDGHRVEIPFLVP